MKPEAQTIPGPRRKSTGRTFLIGTLDGEGIGPEVLAATRAVANAVSRKFDLELTMEAGGVIGLESKKLHAMELSPAVIDFCAQIFAGGGAILTGPGGGRYVYDLRRRFDLFCKVNPLLSFPELARISRLKNRSEKSTNILLVRENLEGIYQGMTLEMPEVKSQTLSHTFYCSETNVRQLLEKAARLAADRKRRCTVIVKRGALPVISRLWEACAEQVMSQQQIGFEMMDIDFAAYQLLQAPEAFDVIAAPNCFGDILADLGGLFFGSRGLTFGASYSSKGAAVYQTNHGCAYDLAGTDRANPVGQIFSLAMLLQESFQLAEASDAIFSAVRSVWADGWRTADLMEPGCRELGTSAMAEKITAIIHAEAFVV